MFYFNLQINYGTIKPDYIISFNKPTNIKNDNNSSYIYINSFENIDEKLTKKFKIEYLNKISKINYINIENKNINETDEEYYINYFKGNDFIFIKLFKELSNQIFGYNNLTYINKNDYYFKSSYYYDNIDKVCDNILCVINQDKYIVIKPKFNVIVKSKFYFPEHSSSDILNHVPRLIYYYINIYDFEKYLNICVSVPNPDRSECYGIRGKTTSMNLADAMNKIKCHMMFMNEGNEYIKLLEDDLTKIEKLKFKNEGLKIKINKYENENKELTKSNEQLENKIKKYELEINKLKNMIEKLEDENINLYSSLI